jgi:hypothetical protein
MFTAPGCQQSASNMLLVLKRININPLNTDVGEQSERTFLSSACLKVLRLRLLACLIGVVLK